MVKYPLVHSSWNKLEFQSLKKVIKTGQFTMGKNVSQFELDFSKYLKKKYSIMVNSGSSANLIAISSLFYKNENALKFGDEVIVPAVAWSTTYSPLKQMGLKLKIVDISIKDFNIDYNLLEKAITEKTKLIIAVNLLGIPCELEKIKKICNKKKIYLFEDNCESLGAKIKDKKAGSFGDLSSHSFFYSHHISTMEGGMISTDSYELYCICKALRAHGWSRDLPKKNIYKLQKIKKNNFYEEYKFLIPGYNVRPGEMNASVGIIQLKKINKFIKIRRKNLKLFNKLFSGQNKYLIPDTSFYSSSFSFPIIIKNTNEQEKKKIFKELRKNNIDFRLIAGGCFASQDYAKYFNYTIFRNIKTSQKLHMQGFMVGNAPVDLSSQIEKLYKILSNI